MDRYIKPETIHFYQWLDLQRLQRHSGLALRSSRTQGTPQCQSYVLKRNPQLQTILSPLVPISYILASPDISERELLQLIIESTNHRLAKGTIAQLYNWTFQLLKERRTEMLIIDAAHNLKPSSIELARQISEQLKIAVILVGSVRLEVVISSDERLERRFASRFVFKPLVP